MSEPRIERQDPSDTRRLFAAMFLSLAIYSGYVWWKGPPPPAPEAEPAPVPAAASAAPAVPEVTAPVRTIDVAMCGAVGTVTTDGGVLRGVTLPDFPGHYRVSPLWRWALGLVTGASSFPWLPYTQIEPVASVLTPGAAALAVGSGPLTGVAPRMEAHEAAGEALSLRGVTRDGVEVVTVWNPAGDPCVTTVDVVWTNRGAAPFQGDLWVGLHDALPAGAAYGQTPFPIALVDEALDYPKLKNLADAAEPSEGPVSWFAIADRHFGLFVLPHSPTEGGLQFSRRGTDDAPVYGAHWVHAATLAPGERYAHSFRVHAGPLNEESLAVVDPTLTDAVDYGWMAAFSGPMLWALHLVHGAVGGWGWSIVWLTVAVKLLLFPVIHSGMKSSMKMAAIQPKMQELRERLKDDPEEMNRQIMALFRDSGANPLGGCLPLLLQIPVFASLYGVLLTSADLYNAPFFYLLDLSSPDPYGALPLATIGLMWVQQQMMPMGNMDPAQQQILKFMPILFGLFFFTAPSGLGVYMLVNIALSIVQQWMIRRQFPTQTPAVTPV